MTPTILVVDDQEDERDAMAALLRRHHYLVESAANGQEALDRLCDGAPPDMVLLDLDMPVMDGWELLDRLAQDRALRRIPVIVVSGAAGVADAIVVPASVMFVAKPVRPDAIISLITDMLQEAALAPTPAANEDTATWIDRVDTERHGAAPGDPAIP